MKFSTATLAAVTMAMSSLSVAKAGEISIEVHVKKGKDGEQITEPLKGATVKCYDDDPGNGRQDVLERATFLASGETKKDGKATLTYTTKDVTGKLRKNKSGGYDKDEKGNARNPDIICQVSKADYLTMYTTTKWNQNQDKTADFKKFFLAPDRKKLMEEDEGEDNGCGPAFLEGVGADWEALEKEDVMAAFTEFSGLNLGCQNHDWCYSDCSGDENQHTCDLEAKRVWLSECDRMMYSKEDKAACKTTARQAFALIMSPFGYKAWSDKQEKYGCEEMDYTYMGKGKFASKGSDSGEN